MTTFLDAWVLNTLRECGLRKPERIAAKVIEVIEEEKRFERIAQMTGTDKEVGEAVGLTPRRIRQIRREYFKGAA